MCYKQFFQCIFCTNGMHTCILFCQKIPFILHFLCVCIYIQSILKTVKLKDKLRPKKAHNCYILTCILRFEMSCLLFKEITQSIRLSIPYRFWWIKSWILSNWVVHCIKDLLLDLLYLFLFYILLLQINVLVVKWIGTSWNNKMWEIWIVFFLVWKRKDDFFQHSLEVPNTILLWSSVKKNPEAL